MSDFLRTAQHTKVLDLAIARQECINGFDERFVNLGSCFAINMQRVLQSYGFHVWYDRNICGHYSSGTMASTLALVAEGCKHGESELYEYQDKLGGIRPYQYFFKRRVHGPDAARRIIDAVSALDNELRRELQACSHIILTLGTTRVIRLKRTGKLIVSPGGIPASEYEFDLLSVADVVADLESMLKSIQIIRGGDLPTIFITISPQRYHFRNIPGREHIDPFVDNVLYKSILRVAVEEFINGHRNDPLHYFPSYEIVMEELRQYESLSHYDFMHIEQDHTPKRVIKKFLSAYAGNEVLNQLGLLEDARMLHGEISQALIEEMPPDNPFAVESMEALVAEAHRVAPVERWSPDLVQVLAKLIDGLKREGEHQDILDAVQSRSLGESERVIIWGTAKNYRVNWADWLASNNCRIRMLGFVDGDKTKWGQQVDGFTVYAPDQLPALKPEAVIIASVFREEITDHIRRHLAGVRIL